MRQALVPVRSSRALVVVGLVALAVVGTALVVAQPWNSCPQDWGNAARLHLGNSGGHVVLDGRDFQVGGGALLDYMPRVVTSPLDQARAGRHPLSINASIGAISRDALGDPVFTCFRVTRGNEVWARRPTSYGIQTMADGYPPGAPSPIPNSAWRMASLNDGPEWPDGDQIELELWATVGGRNYVFVLPPFALMRGG
ncbi:MAG TPA: hypothetical protein VFA31_06030 [Candidatus Polarisedimenticolia bacterium]|nr:hypothetical protein [Candidatus Polarisedimenticolia bacterium]